MANTPENSAAGIAGKGNPTEKVTKPLILSQPVPSRKVPGFSKTDDPDGTPSPVLKELNERKEHKESKEGHGVFPKSAAVELPVVPVCICGLVTFYVILVGNSTRPAAMKNLTLWDSHPVQAFKDFVVTQDFAKTGRRLRADGTFKLVSEESAKTYTFMFANVVGWISSQGKTLLTVTHGDLVRFVTRVDGGQRVINSKIAYGYLRLLERCYEYLEVTPNPAKQAILSIDRSAMPKNDAGRRLSAEQLQRFFDALPADPPRRRRVTAFDGWKRRRDRALQLVIALAGLRVAEAIGLLLHEVGQQVALDGSIDLTITPEEKHDTSYEHVTTLPREGVNEMRPWLEERLRMVKQAGLLGDFVFPANIDGGKLTKKTVYMQIRKTFARAGLDTSRAGGRTLRNTFAKGQLDNGASPDELKDVLGLALERSAADYKFTRIKDDPQP